MPRLKRGSSQLHDDVEKAKKPKGPVGVLRPGFLTAVARVGHDYGASRYQILSSSRFPSYLRLNFPWWASVYGRIFLFTPQISSPTSSSILFARKVTPTLCLRFECSSDAFLLLLFFVSGLISCWASVAVLFIHITLGSTQRKWFKTWFVSKGFIKWACQECEHKQSSWWL